MRTNKQLRLEPDFNALPFEADSELVAALKTNPGAVKIFMGHQAEQVKLITHPYPRFQGIIELFQTDVILIASHRPKRIRSFFVCLPENKSYVFTATAKIQVFRADQMDFNVRVQEFGTSNDMRALFSKYAVR